MFFLSCKFNKGCREVYDRMTNKGKSKKLALIAKSNTLLKQAFAIVKSVGLMMKCMLQYCLNE
jgi:hypothetical protein